jgi:hypothetical protein
MAGATEPCLSMKEKAMEDEVCFSIRFGERVHRGGWVISIFRRIGFSFMASSRLSSVHGW